MLQSCFPFAKSCFELFIEHYVLKLIGFGYGGNFFFFKFCLLIETSY
ncbi:hypothetical protein WN944_029007 [Citrus x changshan-huyou]|uniref:Uncharacterized protein n=1 Tax=Citrus x changshan-huyou TaxID=2935761 RepID=A0AAP0QAP5_9ROSI